MDLRSRQITPQQRAIIEQNIVTRVLGYQPFIFADDLEVGAGQHFIQEIKHTRLLHWTTHDPRVSDVLTDNVELFRQSNARLREVYERFMDFMVEQLGDIRGLSFAEVGCNTGYFLFGLALRGARQCLGYDFSPGYELFQTLNEILGTRCEFHFADWDSLQHRLNYNPLPEVDVAMSIAVTCHLADPIHHLAYLCDHSRKAVFVWCPIRDENRLCLYFDTPGKLTKQLAWPLSFDQDVRFSVPLLRMCLEQAGFEDIRELCCPATLPPEWQRWFGGQRGYLAYRTRDIRTALTPEGGKRTRDIPPAAYAHVPGLPRPLPFLVKSHHSYNIVQLHDKFYAIDRALGAMDLTKSDTLTALAGRRDGRCFITRTLAEAEGLVDWFIQSKKVPPAAVLERVAAS